MTVYKVKPIGIIHNNQKGSCIRLNQEYIPALKELIVLVIYKQYGGLAIMTTQSIARF